MERNHRQLPISNTSSNSQFPIPNSHPLFSALPFRIPRNFLVKPTPMAAAVRLNIAPSKVVGLVSADHRYPRRHLTFPIQKKPCLVHRSSPAYFGVGKPNQPIVRSRTCTSAQMNSGIRIGKVQKWWEKGIKPNMREVEGAQHLVDALLNAGDKLVIVDFFSPGCGGCRALHPKICQLAEMNPDVQFLQVNYETHKSMCYSLGVHVLPFFRFYRGALGKVCSFSCTNATINKFKTALAKYGAPDFCSLEPTKGLEEKELIALAANRDLSFSYTPAIKPEMEAPSPAERPPPLPLSSEDKALVSAGWGR